MNISSSSNNDEALSASTLVVTVTGGTGRQGGAVVRHLLRAGASVRVVTRDPDSRAAQALREAGVELYRADLTSPGALRPAFEGASGVFSVQDYWGAGGGRTGEVAQGRAVARAARDAGVRHVVQSTMADTPDGSWLPEHFATKREIETIIDGMGLQRTFIGTVFFMDNFGDRRFGGSLLMPMLSGTLSAATRLHLLAVDDIGRTAAHAFLHPHAFIGRKVNLAGDELTVGQIRSGFHRATGRRLARWRIPPVLARRLNREFATQLQWHEQVNFSFDVPPPAGIPELTTFERYLAPRRPDPAPAPGQPTGGTAATPVR